MSRVLPLVALSALLLNVSSAAAGVVTETSAFSFPLSPGSQNLSIPKFDTLGGTRTLTSVQLKVDATVQANITAENDSAVSGNMGVDLTGLVKASTVGPLSASAFILGSAGPVAVSASDGNPDTGPDFVDFGLLSGNDANSATTLVGLAAYIGPGFLSVLVNGNGGFSATGVTDSTIHVTDFEAFGNVDVVYTYDETGVVPEPASIVVWSLLGLGGVFLVRRRAARA